MTEPPGRKILRRPGHCDRAFASYRAKMHLAAEAVEQASLQHGAYQCSNVYLRLFVRSWTDIWI